MLLSGKASLYIVTGRYQKIPLTSTKKHILQKKADSPTYTLHCYVALLLQQIRERGDNGLFITLVPKVL